MTIAIKTLKTGLTGCAASLVLSLSIGAASAGGLAVREQSTQFLGSAFAGNAAGGGLSSSFWNSAAIGEAPGGLSSESNVTVILPGLEITPTGGLATLLSGGPTGTEDFKDPAYITSSYSAYRWNDNLVFGLAINAPFGLGSKADNPLWSGQFHHQSAKLLTLNLNPMASVRVAPGVYIGLGAQFQYAKLKFKTSTGVPTDSAALVGDDIGVGLTAGILWKPSDSTSIGLGLRTAVAHNIRGIIKNPADPISNGKKFALDLDTPEMVTLSIRQALSERFRLMGTVEWTHWDRLDVHPVYAQLGVLGAVQFANFDFQYSDGWFFALGGEYDATNALTLRGGVAYEISPVDDPSKRLPQIADSDRIWLSLGATYKLNDMMTLDFAYSHIFFDDSKIDRVPASLLLGAVDLQADVQNSADIISVGLKVKLGG